MRYFLLVISILSLGTMGFSKMSLEYEWKYFDILWESPQQKQEAIDSGVYYENATGAFLHGVDKAPDGRIFVTAVKDKGMPVSVMTITEKLGKGGPLLRPYPDWSWYKNETDCNSIVSDVYQVDIKCNHLFFMDSGKRGLDYLCSPKLFIFDLSTDKLVKRVPIPNKIAHIAGIGILTTVFVYAPDCTNIKDNAIVFIGDVEKANLIVYNARSSQMCSLNATSETTKEHMVRRITFPYIDNTFCMTVIGESLHYIALLGTKMYKIEYSKLIQCSQKDIDQASQQTQLMNALESPTSVLLSDRCAIFFSDVEKSSITCADATKAIDFKNKAVIASDPIYLQYVSGMKIRQNKLFVLSSTFFRHLEGPLNANEINFRLFSVPMEEIKRNTNCFSSCNS